MTEKTLYQFHCSHVNEHEEKCRWECEEGRCIKTDDEHCDIEKEDALYASKGKKYDVKEAKLVDLHKATFDPKKIEEAKEYASKCKVLIGDTPNIFLSKTQ
jgi:hypothetical protein